MTKTKKLCLGIATVLMLSGVGASAVMAGAKTISPLGVNGASGFAYGGISDVHNSASTTEYIECGSNTTMGFCTVRENSGALYSCMTTDAAMLAVIRSMSDESYISLSWNANGECTYMLSYASSRAATKAH